MRKFNQIIVFIWFVLTPLTGFSQDTLLLDFPKAVELGMKANLEYRIQENNLEILQKEKQVAMLSHLPSVGINSNVLSQSGQQFQQVEGEIVVTNVTNNIVSGGLNVNMPVFNAGRRILDTQSAKLAYEAGEKGLERAKQQVIFDVAQRYLQVLLDEELVRIARENLENQQEQLRQITGFVDAGIRTVSDLYNQQSEVARLESVLVDAEIQLENDRWALAEYLQLEAGVTARLEPVNPRERGSEFGSQPLNTLYEMAMANRRDFQQQQLLSNSFKKDMQAAKSMFYPRVSAFFNYNTFFTSLDERGFTEQLWRIYPQRTLGLSINIPIFSNWQTRLDVTRAKMAYENQELQEQALDRRIFQDIQLAQQNYQAALKRRANTAVQVKAAEEAKVAVDERFRLGLSNFVDLATGNQTLVAARADQAQAIYTLFFQEVQMRFALGTLEIRPTENPATE
ncbi:TolC family protein [Algoriphagus marincola]|uniref:TolC family protein n=1 Tax=Algoriphagus marincola TaxID=264027 RepID=UPI00041CCA40|nr:TolC family protein [Algoriphagus marincola]